MEETRKKKKKPYVKPEMSIEEFTPDQLVCSVCFNVACTLGENGTKDSNGGTHSKRTDGSGCGWAANQVLKGTNDNFTMVEVNGTNSFGKPIEVQNCNITAIEKDADGVPTSITWTTTTDKTYLHEGSVILKDKSRPLHS